MQIPWFYIYSPKYEIFHVLLKDSVSNSSGFKLCPQFYPQSFFERKPDQEGHLFQGNPIKFQMILEKLVELEDNQPFILSDADILCPNPDNFQTLCSEYSEYDIVGMEEHYINPLKLINIGLIFCKNTPALREFFQTLVETIRITGGHDQSEFNILLRKSSLKWTGFPNNKVSQSNFRENLEIFDEQHIIQLLSCGDHKNSDDTIFEKLITAALFYDLTNLLHLVSPYVAILLVQYFKNDADLQNNPLCDVKIYVKSS